MVGRIMTMAVCSVGLLMFTPSLRLSFSLPSGIPSISFCALTEGVFLTGPPTYEYYYDDSDNGDDGPAISLDLEKVEVMIQEPWTEKPAFYATGTVFQCLYPATLTGEDVVLPF
ncbi:hypothetical protein B0I37DRAFT_405976 [Chaetomium sp. MPI-CAGE-AT-0009]|nr:hypothetical protein B0I37DRAFT_405976 [Chaetomium sp. MPI-CAGE-AT-0009]